MFSFVLISVCLNTLAMYYIATRMLVWWRNFESGHMPFAFGIQPCVVN